MNKILICFFGVALFLYAPVAAQQQRLSETDELSQTIEHLLRYVEVSGLRFVRNSKESDSKSAANHIRKKYRYYKSSIKTPEQFIEKSGSKSLLSGKPYRVILPDNSTREVQDWLLEELQNYRNRRKKG